MITPLREDLNYIRSYMRILEMRFGDRLSYQIDVPSQLEDFPVPKLIAQPIIENARRLRHEAQRPPVHWSVCLLRRG